MNILGVNSGRAAPPRVDPTKIRRLADGSAALLKDGRICCASIEERLARVRYAPGFRESSLACIANGKLTLGAIDAIGHSTCCDIAWSDPGDLLDDIADTWEGIYSRTAICEALGGKVFTVDHHESHAALAFVGSGFRRALVAVIDGMGNRYGVPGEFNVSEDWWRGAFQRHDYYLCEWRNGRLRIEKVHEDAHREGEIGLGEIYRSVTHFLGWPTYQHAGKTMALAAYGRPERLDRARLIDFVAPFSTHVPVPSLHRHPITQIGDAIRKGGYRLPDLSAGKGTPQNAFLCDVAALVQHQLETALASGVIALAEKFGTTNIALGGGVAMNCVALGKLATLRPDLRLYIPPAPADTGQALGNALWLAYAENSPVVERVLPGPITSAALGLESPDSEIDSAVAGFLKRHPAVTASKVTEPASLAKRIVDDLARGNVVGLRRGRAEYGPRALGQASILADPRSAHMHERVNTYKRREPFRPYAPSVLTEHVTDYFETNTPSPFMSFAGTVRPEKRCAIPAVVHVDGSARYQSVDRDLGFYRLLLESWHRRTGVPVLLNTSFNQDSEPVVEKPTDALDCFQRSGLPILVLGNWHLQQTST